MGIYFFAKIIIIPERITFIYDDYLLKNLDVINSSFFLKRFLEFWEKLLLKWNNEKWKLRVTATTNYKKLWQL